MRHVRLSVLLVAALGMGLLAFWQLALFEEPAPRESSPRAPQDASGSAVLVGSPVLRKPVSTVTHPVIEGDLQADPAARVSFSGTVLVGEEPAPAAEIVVRRDGGSVALRADAEGRFEADIPAGRYDLLFRAGSRGALFRSGQVVDGVQWHETEVVIPPTSSLWLRFLSGADPLEGLPVSARPEHFDAPELTYEAVTDAAGIVRIDGMAPGNYEVRVPFRDSWMLRLSLTPERTPALLDRVLPSGPGAVLRGTVRDASSGIPVPDAYVLARLRSIGSGTWLLSETHTDAEGRYDFPAIRGSLLSLDVQAEGYADYPSDPRSWIERQRALAWDENEALVPTHAHLAAGEEVVFDVELERGRTLAGTIRDEHGRGVPDLFFRISRQGRFGSVFRMLRTDGVGEYAATSLGATRWGFGWPHPGYYPLQPVVVPLDDGGEGPFRKDIEVRRSRVLAGTVQDVAGAPVGGARVWVDGEQRMLLGARHWERVLETFTAADGTWTLADVPPWDEIEIRASKDAADALPRSTSDLGPRPAPIVFVLGEASAIRGRIEAHDCRTFRSAKVRAVSASGRRVDVTVRGTAEFELRNLEPDLWRLSAWALGRATPEPVEVDLATGDLAVVALPLSEEVVLAGRVVNATGDPLAGARVRLNAVRWHDAEGRWQRTKWREIRTDADGRFRFEDTRAGEADLTVSVSGYPPARIRDLGGYERDLEIVLESR